MQYQPINQEVAYYDCSTIYTDWGSVLLECIYPLGISVYVMRSYHLRGYIYEFDLLPDLQIKALFHKSRLYLVDDSNLIVGSNPLGLCELDFDR